MAGKTAKASDAAGRQTPTGAKAAPAGAALARVRAKGSFWLRVEVPIEAAAALLGG
ncbi:hypothetical protein [Sorangium sp. So ce117]|uniref:hypothetical protein n=1 Tax=Sorangium sp. So ce117 TaxID=3133277 RepID=UPI003F5EA16D